MMIERSFVDGYGDTVRVVVTIAESGSALERAVARLANKARRSESGKAKALDGAVVVEILPADHPASGSA